MPKRKTPPSPTSGRKLLQQFQDDSDDEVVFLAARPRPTSDVNTLPYDNVESNEIHYEMQDVSDASKSTVKSITGKGPSIKKDQPAIDADDREQIRQALLGPQRRGRKVGSGQGEQRKALAEYSTNANTQKSRRRIAKMNPYQKRIERAKRSADSWVSKNLMKWKKSAEFLAIPESERANHISRKRIELRQERERTFSESSADAEIHRLMRQFLGGIEEDQELQDQLDVKSLQRSGVSQRDDKWWRYCDSESGSDGEDTTVIDGRLPTIRGTTITRRFKQSQEKTVNDIAWNQIKKNWSRHYNSLNAKLLVLRWMGPIFRDEVTEQRRKGHPIPITTATLGPRWNRLKHKIANKATPAKFFSRDEATVVRFFWGLDQDHEWVELPGPSQWWPDYNGDGSPADRRADQWYRQSGFDLPSFHHTAYRKAWVALQSKTPPKAWARHLIHDNREIAWV